MLEYVEYMLHILLEIYIIQEVSVKLFFPFKAEMC